MTDFATPKPVVFGAATSRAVLMAPSVRRFDRCSKLRLLLRTLPFRSELGPQRYP